MCSVCRNRNPVLSSFIADHWVCKKHDGATSGGGTIAASLSYGVYISQLIRYSKACVKYSNFLDRAQMLTQKQSYSNKATFLLGWCHRYKNSTIVITIWWTGTKYPYLKWQWILYFLRKCFLSATTANTFTGLDCIWIARRVSYKKQELLPFAGTWAHPHFVFFVCFFLFTLFVFVCA